MVFWVDGSNGAISGSIISQMAADGHLGMTALSRVTLASAGFSFSLYTVSGKQSLAYFVHNFIKYWSIFNRSFVNIIVAECDFETVRDRGLFPMWEIVGISKSTLDLRSNQCNYWLGVVHLTCGNK